MRRNIKVFKIKFEKKISSEIENSKWDSNISFNTNIF